MSVIATSAPAAALGPLPSAPAFNLFTVALDLAAADVQAQMGIVGRWQGGVAVWPRPGEAPLGYDNCATGGTMDVKEEGTPLDNKTFLPFSAYIPDSCTGAGIGDWEEFKSRANSVLLATEAFAAERQLARGYAVGTNPSLNDTNLAVLGSGVGPNEGLALLENAIGATGRAGVLHATPGIATMWAASRQLLWTGDVIRAVATRTPVIVGHGYIGTDPDAAASPTGDTEWAFATGPVFAGRGDLMELDEEIAGTLERTLNDVVYRAERDMVVGWDGALQVGVLIDRSATP